MRYEISGTTMQTVAVDLGPGETLYSQTNCMAWMSDNIQMNTHTGGGLFAGIKRSLSGGSLFITEFTAMGLRPHRLRAAVSRHNRRPPIGAE